VFSIVLLVEESYRAKVMLPVREVPNAFGALYSDGAL
jgi:hypothetical protein